MLIDGKIATGYKKAFPLLEASICHLIIAALCFYKIRKNFRKYKKKNSPLFQLTKQIFQVNEEEFYSPTESYDEFSLLREREDISLIENWKKRKKLKKKKKNKIKEEDKEVEKIKIELSWYEKVAFYKENISKNLSKSFMRLKSRFWVENIILRHIFPSYGRVIFRF